MSQRWAVTCKECHGPAFVVLGELPKPSDVVMAARCEHLDGRPMQGTDPMLCDSCGTDFTRTGVEPSTAWRLLPELFAEPHTPQDAPWGTHADPRDVASVRLAIQTFQPIKRPRAPRKRAVREETA
jgi:hypothetical protein